MADEREKVLEDDDLLTRLEIWFKNNKKMVFIVGGGLVAIVGGLLAYKYLYVEKRENKAATIMYGGDKQQQSAFYHFERDSFRLAAEGDQITGVKGLDVILKDYDNTQVGLMASYMWGISHLHMGADNAENYAEAAKWLNYAAEEIDEEEVLIGTHAIGAQGDALAEQGDLEGAVKKYEAASKRNPNVLLTPYYMMKAAIVHEELGNWSEALKLYKDIQSTYPDSDQAKGIAKYIGRAQQKV